MLKWIQKQIQKYMHPSMLTTNKVHVKIIGYIVALFFKITKYTTKYLEDIQETTLDVLSYMKYINNMQMV